MTIDMEAIKAAIIVISSSLWQFLNSNFFIASITAFFGAFAGAVGAQIAAIQSERKKRTIEEIRSTNAAIMVSFTIVNSFIGMKRQHIKRLKENYDHQRQRFIHLQTNGNQLNQDERRIDLDLQALQPQNVPLETLQGLLFEKISVVGRPLTLVAILSQCVDALNGCLKLRNEFIDWSKSQGPNSQAVLARYFGLPTPMGQDLSFPDCIDGISSFTDDCIFFSWLIGEDLHRHGERLRARLGKRSPPLHKLDYSKVEGFMPDKSQYGTWLNMEETQHEN